MVSPVSGRRFHIGHSPLSEIAECDDSLQRFKFNIHKFLLHLGIGNVCYSFYRGKKFQLSGGTILMWGHPVFFFKLY